MSDQFFTAPWVGTLPLVGIEIKCAVLNDKENTRVISTKGMVKALGYQTGGSDFRKHKNSVLFSGGKIPIYLSSPNLIPFISKDLLDAFENPIRYVPSDASSLKPAIGLPATLVPMVCDVYLKARDAGELKTATQIKAARQADLIMRALAHIGIIALVDEATGYQEIRDRDALQKILDKYLLKEHAKWAKRFPDEFYSEMFRLKGWTWKGMRVNRPSVVAHYTKDIVYNRLAPGILKELENRNPIDEKGKRGAKHHQFLTDDIGHPALQQHLHAVIGLMRAAGNYGQFHRLLERAFPKLGETLPLALDD